MTADRCPSCDAPVRRDDVPWCLQCYASLVPEPEPEPEPEVRPAADAVREAGAEDETDHTAPTQPVDIEQLAGSMLAELARSERAPTRRWARATANRRTAMLWATACSAGAVVLLIVALALLGRFV